MDNAILTAFRAAPRTEEIYRLFLAAIDGGAMRSHISRGVLVGLSGGADSVMLTLLLLEYRRREGLDFPIVTLHVNHSIRGEEALADERLARSLAEGLGLEFILRTVDVPSIAKREGKGLEEAARDVRYALFSEIIAEREDVGSVALGHNATDNLETVVFNMMRGAGLRGISGIPPTREVFFRPMLYIPKSDIAAALTEAKIPFATDSTNSDIAYTRNYIRHEIIPRLAKLTDSPEVSVTRLTQNLRADGDYIDSVAKDFLRENSPPSAESLRALHPAVFARVVSEMARCVSGKSPERCHIDKIRDLLSSDSFSYSLPGGCEMVLSGGVMKAVRGTETTEMHIPLRWGVNSLPEYSASVELFDRVPEISHNVYNFSIQADLSSAIIKGDIYIRSRREGDAYRYGGMTRRLKRLLADADVPRTDRARVPVVCDGAGILYVAGFGVRDDGVKGEAKFIRISYNDSERGFLIPRRKRYKNKKGAVDT